VSKRLVIGLVLVLMLALAFLVPIALAAGNGSQTPAPGGSSPAPSQGSGAQCPAGGSGGSGSNGGAAYQTHSPASTRGTHEGGGAYGAAAPPRPARPAHRLTFVGGPGRELTPQPAPQIGSLGWLAQYEASRASLRDVRRRLIAQRAIAAAARTAPSAARPTPTDDPVDEGVSVAVGGVPACGSGNAPRPWLKVLATLPAEAVVPAADEADDDAAMASSWLASTPPLPWVPAAGVVAAMASTWLASMPPLPWVPAAGVVAAEPSLKCAAAAA